MAGKRDNRAVTYLDDDETAKLKEWADETGKSQSTLLREAVQEYLDLDRHDRMERKLAELADEVADLRTVVEADRTHTPKMGGLNDAHTATDGGRPDAYTAENVEAADPPPTNASVTRKVDYLAALVKARADEPRQVQLHAEKFRENDVAATWDYADDDRPKLLVEKTIERLGLNQHPRGIPLYVSDEREAEIESALADTEADTAEVGADD